MVSAAADGTELLDRAAVESQNQQHPFLSELLHHIARQLTADCNDLDDIGHNVDQVEYALYALQC